MERVARAASTRLVADIVLERCDAPPAMLDPNRFQRRSESRGSPSTGA
jgi:hypothetical protein